MPGLKKFKVGERLPDPFFERASDRSHAYFRVRACPKCGFQWPTSEVAMFPKWEGKKANACPVHASQPSKELKAIDIRKAQKWGYSSNALLHVLSFGGVYRRRKCKVINCRDAKDKESRWSTAEISTEGVVVPDIVLCPRCKKDYGKILTRSKPLTALASEKDNV